MRRFLQVVLASALVWLPLRATTFQVKGADEKAWGKILGSVGIRPAASGSEADIVILGSDAQVDAAALANSIW
jgi:putative cell wall-binding protein